MILLASIPLLTAGLRIQQSEVLPTDITTFQIHPAEVNSFFLHPEVFTIMTKSHSKKEQQVIRRRRAVNYRRQKYGEEISDPNRSMTVLENHSVLGRQKSNYTKIIHVFLTWAMGAQIMLRVPSPGFAPTPDMMCLWDASLVEYMEERFMEGDQCHVGDQLMSAVKYRYPWVKDPPGLPRCIRAQKGWRKLHPIVHVYLVLTCACV
jgi:hypothetical protein